MPKPEVLLDGLAFPEGPRWHEDRLFFSDMHGRRVVAVDMTGASETIVEVPNQPSGLGWLPDGSMLVVSMVDRKVLRFEDGALVGARRSLDARARELQRHGRRPPRPRLRRQLRLRHVRRRAVAQDEPPRASNPTVGRGSRPTISASPTARSITPDNETLIVGESTAARLTAFDIGTDGKLTNRRVWASLRDIGATPDGICLDADGAVWVACPATDRCVRVAEGGKLLDEVATGRGTFACVLGGPDGRTLFICTADAHEPDLARPRRAGASKRSRSDTPGA